MIHQFEIDIHTILHHNSIVFLNDSIERLLNGDNGGRAIDPDLLVLTCMSFQTSLELAIKALIIEREGILPLLNSKQQKLDMVEIEALFRNNGIKAEDFDKQKNFIKSRGYIHTLTKEDFLIIEEFQNYRNKIVHFFYVFPPNQLLTIKEYIVFYMMHVIFKILLSNNYDLKPHEFLDNIIGSCLRHQLVSYQPYRGAMEKLAQRHSKEVYQCIHCLTRALSKDEDYCYMCNAYYQDHTMINCDMCGKIKSVIYDNLNIHINNHQVNGLCLNCDDKSLIFECVNCGDAYNIYTTNSQNRCTNNLCLHQRDHFKKLER